MHFNIRSTAKQVGEGKELSLTINRNYEQERRTANC